jgi:peptide deformylase
MILPITKDIDTLHTVSEPASWEDDRRVVIDLLNTAQAHEDRCAGLAAIQIGIPKRVIVVKMGSRFAAMLNPVILWRSKETYTAEEGCLSLDGTRKVKRHEAVKVGYQDRNGKRRLEQYGGMIAEIIQHEVDHCNGILI